MKVRELIALLQEQDQDAEVKTEGCDCIGTANGVETMQAFTTLHICDATEEPASIIITRSEE